MDIKSEILKRNCRFLWSEELFEKSYSDLTTDVEIVSDKPPYEQLLIALQKLKESISRKFVPNK